ncbi:hypothetical protein K3Z84_24710, partial [Pseudomonas aeruginosa]|nr:hypothetical protein [Pseudomonas aeruginosa]
MKPLLTALLLVLLGAPAAFTAAHGDHVGLGQVGV